ncbi:MAG TPA: MerR family transcriptional regulator [Paenibacillaceae bacterium]
MYTIGQFARKTGVTTRTLRFYDKKGLLKPSYLSESGRRFYTDKDLLTLQNILVFKYLGYSLDEIRTMLRSDAGQDFRASLKRQHQEMLQEKKRIEKVLETLETALALAEQRDSIDPEIFLSVIHNLVKEDEQKAFLKSLLPEELVDELFETSREDLLKHGGRFLEVLGKLKDACRRRLPDEEMLPVLRELVGMLPKDLMDRLTEQSGQLEELEFDDALFPLPLTKEEEQWLAEVIERVRDRL